jgi:hypothetical protein
MLQWLHLPLFIPTFLAIIFRPLQFFRAYHDIATTRSASFWSLNAEKAGDAYLAPVKFAALTVAISNLIAPLLLALGPQVGAVSQDYVEFARWAEGKGYLEPLKFTGLGFIDKFLRDLLALLVFYGLGHTIALLSAGKVSPRFAAGHFYYWNAWALLGNLLSIALIVMSLTIPLYQTPLPNLVGIVMFVAMAFMFLGFPILFWPRIMDISWQRAALAVVGGFAIWVAAIAILAPFIVTMPDFSDLPPPRVY